MSKNDLKTDIAIIGGGLAGLTLACLLGSEGIEAICLDQADPAQQITADERTTAISYGSRKILEQAGIWPYLEDKACPIRDIRILDGHSTVLLNFLSSEVKNKDFGWIVDNADLRQAGLDRLSELPSVRHMAPVQATAFETGPDQVSISLATGTKNKIETIQARLLVGADGRKSAVRNWMDVETREWDYGQRAVICLVRHENPHHNAAIEHFWPQGPFAVLPMCDDKNGAHRSSVVFTEHGPARDSLMHYSDKAFTAALQAKFPADYGTVELASKRQCYPLNLIHAARYTAARAVLVADAAHGIHPIAGQGLNLGFRDVKALADLLIQARAEGQDYGAPELLQRYERQRRPDNMAMVAVTDALVRLFSNNVGPVRALRSLGLRAVSRLRPAKKFFMKQAMADRG